MDLVLWARVGVRLGIGLGWIWKVGNLILAIFDGFWRWMRVR
jgi:hypothetical protein